MVKRSVDIVLSLVGLICCGPILLLFAALVRFQDGGPALYRPLRAGRGSNPFRMYKLRSMRIDADSTGVSSTSNSDTRITSIGRIIRRYKVDELMQLINVLIGEMSLVGPRPNLISETNLYTSEEQRLLTVKPGITDFSSIVFADEGHILEGFRDPDLAYNQLIRPWKSRLGLFYVDHSSTTVDMALIFFTALSLLSRNTALRGVCWLLSKLGASGEIVRVAQRESPLTPHPPPGTTSIWGES